MVSPDELVEILAQLKRLLTNLPSELPLRDAFNSESKYSTFFNFDLDPEILDKTGDEVATLGEQLETYLVGRHVPLKMASFQLSNEGLQSVPYIASLKRIRSQYADSQVTYHVYVQLTSL